MKSNRRALLRVLLVVAFWYPASAEAGEFLLNNGSIPNGTGRKVSGVNVADGWRVYQAFDVPGGTGWALGSIGVDGWRVQDPAGLGQTGMICSDDGTGTTANCTSPIVAVSLNLGNINPFESGWVDVPVNAMLQGGTRYWFVSSANHADYWTSLYHAPAGLASYSIRTSDGMRFDSGPTALRIQGPLDVPALTVWGLAALSVLVLTTGGVVIRRRRKALQAGL